MGLVHAEIELVNAAQIEMAKKHFIGEDEVKRILVRALVDSGSIMLCINEGIKEYLELSILENRRIQLADGRLGNFDIAGPLEVRFKNRRTVCQAIVLPDDCEVLLGCIPIEDMDVIIDPARQELIVHPDHPYMAQVSLKVVPAYA